MGFNNKTMHDLSIRKSVFAYLPPIVWENKPASCVSKNFLEDFHFNREIIAARKIEKKPFLKKIKIVFTLRWKIPRAYCF